jgi:hypothetical protein
MTDSEIANAPSASFTITDPDSVFVDYRLDCTDHIGIRGERPSEEATADEAVMNSVDGLGLNDVVEPAGYVESESSRPMARITRQGRIVRDVLAGQVRRRLSRRSRARLFGLGDLDERCPAPRR